MAAGIAVYDAAGNLIFDTDDRLYRILTTVVAGTGGSFTNAEIGGATILGTAVQMTDAGKKPPVVTVSGSTVSWTFSGGSGINDTGATIQVLAF